MRLKAFTIIEIIVTLAISTFIVMVAMMVYLVVNKQFSEYKRLNDELQKIYEVNFLLQKDIQESKSFEFNPVDSTLTFTGLNEQVHLKISEDLLIRQQTNNIDTFNLQLEFGTVNDLSFDSTSNVLKVIYMLGGNICFSGFRYGFYDSETLMELNSNQ